MTFIKNTAWSVLAACSVFCLLVSVLWIQARHLDREDNQHQAEDILNYTHVVLREAGNATKESEKFAHVACTEAAQNGLSDIAATYPHLHSITLINHGYAQCSSLTGAQIRDLSHIHFTGHSLTRLALSTSGKTRRSPMLILATLLPGERRTDTAISGLFLQNHMKAHAANTSLWLRVGEQMMDAQGQFTSVKNRPKGAVELVDPELPFSLIYDESATLPVVRFMQNWPLPLLASLLVALASGVICYRWISREVSPRRRIHQALINGDIRTVYQPIVSSGSGKIIGFEALCRWQHKTEGFISPDIFIPQAEQTGVIVLLTQYQLAQIARDMKTLAPLISGPFYISINFSRQHYTSGAFVYDCLEFMRALKPLGGKMLIEITEREPLELTPGQTKKFRYLRHAGAGIALDDFGTGYSNLAYISSLAPDYLKIDKLFVSRMSQHHTILLDCVTDMVDKLGIQAIAEGVETAEQAEYLRQRGVDSQQGYHWHKPMDKQMLFNLLKTAQR